MRYSRCLTVAFAASSPFLVHSAVIVNTTNNALILANSIVTGQLTVSSANYTGAVNQSGIYSSGPFGLRNGAVLTTDIAADVINPNRSFSHSLGTVGSPLCSSLVNGTPSYDAAVLTFSVFLAAPFKGFFANFVFQSDEYTFGSPGTFNDVMGLYVDGVQVAFDSKNNPIRASGDFLNTSTAILPPGSGTNMPSSKILTSRYPTTNGLHLIQLAICDITDSIYMSAVFMTIGPCAGNCTGVTGISSCANSGGDSDDDGICDQQDNCPLVYNPDQKDTDGNGIGDACDPCLLLGGDTDKDGICNKNDNCPLVANPGQGDSDGDGVGDACDICKGFPNIDTDGDGTCDDKDNCPFISNPGQADTNGDGIGNDCNPCPGSDGDTDGDKICGKKDNCPMKSNPDQRDSDDDWVGDACDYCKGYPNHDKDKDGICEADDNCPEIANPGQEDSLGNGVGDACRCRKPKTTTPSPCEPTTKVACKVKPCQQTVVTSYGLLTTANIPASTTCITSTIY